MAEVAERKHRKNNQSRARAARLRERISEIKKKPEDARTEDDLKVIDLFARYAPKIQIFQVR